jgi:hypothetical protein
MKRYMFILIARLVCLSAVCVGAEKQTSKADDGMNVLFVGNCYTFYNDMPEMLGRMVEAVCVDKKGILKLSVDKILEGGATLQGHWDNPKRQLVKKIDHCSVDGKFEPIKRDFVVLQDQSLSALKPASRQRMFKYARLICEEVKAKGVTPIFYMTWGRRVTFNPDGSGKMADRKFMYEEVRGGESIVVDPKVVSSNDGIAKTYRKIADELGAKVAPCGVAFAKAIKAGIVVHQETEKDGSHPNLTGSYLVACVFYGTIYDRNPEEIPDNVIGKVEPELAAKLQTIAKLAVQEEKLRKAKLKGAGKIK